MADHNDWQRRARQPLTHSDVGVGEPPRLNNVPCPNCGHTLARHSVDLGCHVGWGSKDCPEVHDGCECPLTVAKQHYPLTETEMP